ncbi:MAG: proline dehydrogenase family protein [Steroidobacteraceae bacterium]
MNISSELKALRTEIAVSHRVAETQLLPRLMQLAGSTPEEWRVIQQRARQLIAAARSGNDNDSRPWVAELLREYPLNSREGLALMGLAECSLRVPDRLTLNLLIRDKLLQGDWQRNNQADKSWLVRSSARALQFGRYLLDPRAGASRRLLGHLAQPIIRNSCLRAMRLIGDQFVFATDIEAALQRARSASCSFDMLGEAARTAADAERYYQAYAHAITTLGQQMHAGGIAPGQHSISIKLSALHPRYEALQADRAMPELVAHLGLLAERAMSHGVGLTIDAEECDRLEMSLDIIAGLLQVPTLRDWQGLSLAVQAYQKRALPVIKWLNVLARDHGRRIGVRLVKGAYWDMEIKRCQERGLSDFPVFTRKTSTDVSYLACARELLASQHLVPAFATHNALTVATLLSWIGVSRRDRADDRAIEFQRLHGMAAGMYAAVRRDHDLPCRVYAPVGQHHELLPYLIRRMLENSSNSGFIQQLGNPSIGVDALVHDPIQQLQQHGYDQHPAIQSPAQLFATHRNSSGMDLADRPTLDALNAELQGFDRQLSISRTSISRNVNPS